MGGVGSFSGQRVFSYPAYLLPQGMVEAGDTVSATLKKEFGEEAMNSLEATEQEKREIEKHIDTLFHSGERVCYIDVQGKGLICCELQIYAGYVDDPRNTDCSWMETVAENFHDEAGKTYDCDLIQWSLCKRNSLTTYLDPYTGHHLNSGLSLKAQKFH